MALDNHAMASIQATWQWPHISLFAVPYLTLVLQSCLAVNPALTSRPVRRLLAIPCSIIVWRSFYTVFTPEKAFLPWNVVIRLSQLWATLRSIEYGIASESDYRWIGFDAAYGTEKSRHPPTGLDTHSENSSGECTRATLVGSWQTFMWGNANLCSLRGIGWAWGIKHPNIPSPHPKGHVLPSLLLRLAWSTLLTSCCYGSIAHVHSSGGIQNVLEPLVQNFAYVDITSVTFQQTCRLLNTYLFGLAIFGGLESGYSFMTLLAYALTMLLRALLPVSIAPAPFNRRAWPRLMKAPHCSSSLHNFWAKRWHGLFSRSFGFAGGTPARIFSEKLGLPRFVKQFIIALGVFSVSGILHERYNHATPWLPRDPSYKSYTFFAGQSVGLCLETIFTRISGKRVGGLLGWLWTFVWLGVTATPIAETWAARGLGDFMRPVSEWQWWRWIVPLGFAWPHIPTRVLKF